MLVIRGLLLLACLIEKSRRRRFSDGNGFPWRKAIIRGTQIVCERKTSTVLCGGHSAAWRDLLQFNPLRFVVAARREVTPILRWSVQLIHCASGFWTSILRWNLCLVFLRNPTKNCHYILPLITWRFIRAQRRRKRRNDWKSFRFSDFFLGYWVFKIAFYWKLIFAWLAGTAAPSRRITVDDFLTTLLPAIAI